MLVKVISLKFDAMSGGFDDLPLRDFIQDKEVLQVRDHLLIRSEIPYLILVVKYYPFRIEHNPATKTSSHSVNTKQSDADAWKKDLNESDLPLFNRLRDWRSERCKKDGIPPYLIFTNLQLAEIVKAKPQSLAALAKIDGVGPGKIEKYSFEILAIMEQKAVGETNG
jgi:superfamily II DNA helicase RecQ